MRRRFYYHFAYLMEYEQVNVGNLQRIFCKYLLYRFSYAPADESENFKVFHFHAVVRSVAAKGSVRPNDVVVAAAVAVEYKFKIAFVFDF